jgi:4-aminobutyrate aminotransferase
VPIAPPLVRGRGARVYDAFGKEYLDCCSQTLNLNLGQCHPEIEAAVIDQVKKLTFASSRFSSDVAERLAAKLIEVTPPALCRVNLKSTSGSCANECAIKAARKETGKKTIFSILHSHHGQTAEMMRISGKHFANSYLGARGAVFLPLPTHCAEIDSQARGDDFIYDDLETLWSLHSGDIAAVIVEPVLVDAGVIAPSRHYLTQLRTFCTARGVALIFDEVQTAFGWLGTLHAMEHFSMVPDIVTFGKGLGAGFPIAATLMTKKYDVLEYGEHELTYGAHPVSCAAALKMIEVIQRPGFLELVRTKAALIESMFSNARGRFGIISEVRGIGFLWGVELDSTGPDRTNIARDVVARLQEDGLILRTSKVGLNSSVLQFKPPLVITEDELGVAFDKIAKALSRY